MGRVCIEISSFDFQMLSANHPSKPREEALGKAGMSSSDAVTL